MHNAATQPMLSLVIPVYNNEENLPRLFAALEELDARMPGQLEVVFVTDGPTDGSLRQLRAKLPAWRLRTQLVELSRNFGSFAAIQAGLAEGRGEFFAVLAADLQEPIDLIARFHQILATGEADVALGQRTSRADQAWSSSLFWRLYRRFAVRDTPEGGVDIFGCTRQVRDHLVALTEVNTNLVALLLWLGFRRAVVPYARQARLEGRSGWTLGRKIRYALDSIFSFTDLPVRALLLLGGLGTLFALVASVTVFVMWTLGRIPVLGYTPLMLVITLFGGLTALGLGIIGQYQWLALQNARRRPNFVVKTVETFDPQRSTAARNSS